MFKDFGVLNKDSLTDRLYHLSFDSAAKMIERFEDSTRTMVLKEIDELKLTLNEQMCKIDEYTMVDGYPRPLCQMDEYHFMASMVKRLDILITMLCDVNDALEEHTAYEAYYEMEKLRNQSPEERIEYARLMESEGKTIVNEESLERDLDACAGNISRMKTLANTAGVYNDDMKNQAAVLTKRYFNKKLKIDMEAK